MLWEHVHIPKILSGSATHPPIFHVLFTHMLTSAKTLFWILFPNQVFPNQISRFYWLFSTTQNLGSFKQQTRIFCNTWNWCCIQILVILITLKL